MKKARKRGSGVRLPVPPPGCAHGSERDYDRSSGKLDLKRALAGEEPDGTYCVECAQVGQYPQVYVFQSRTLELREKPAGVHQLFRRTTLRYRCANGHQWEEWTEMPASNPI